QTIVKPVHAQVDAEAHSVVVYEAARHWAELSGDKPFQDAKRPSASVEDIEKDRGGLSNRGIDPHESLRRPVAIHVEKADVADAHRPFGIAEHLDRLMLGSGVDGRDHGVLLERDCHRGKHHRMKHWDLTPTVCRCRLTDRAQAAGASPAGARAVGEVPCPPGHDTTASFRTRAPVSFTRSLGGGHHLDSSEPGFMLHPSVR